MACLGLVEYSDDSSSSEGEESVEKCAEIDKKGPGSKRKTNDGETRDVSGRKCLKTEAPKMQ